MVDVTSEEKEAIQALLKPYGQELIFRGKLFVSTAEGKKSKSELRVVALGSHRLYVLKPSPKCSLVQDTHILDISEVVSASAIELVVRSRTGAVLAIENAPESTVTELSQKLYNLFLSNFPGIGDQDLPKFNISDGRLDRDPDLDGIEPCGGFVGSYRCVCNHLGTPVLHDVCWDIETLFPLNDVRVFNLTEVDLRKEKMSPMDARALLTTLNHNQYFGTLEISHTKLSSEVAAGLAGVLQSNNTLETLNLARVANLKDSISQISTSLFSNKELSLTRLDISDCRIEDKGMSALASSLGSFFRGIVSLNVSQNCGKQGMMALAKAIESNQTITDALEELDISGNKLDAEAAKSWSTVLSKCWNLHSLDVSGVFGDSRPCYGQLQPTRMVKTLRVLKCKDNKIVTKDSLHLELLQFFRMFPSLRELDLGATGFPAEQPLVTSFFDGTALPQLRVLDVSDNELGDAGLLSFSVALIAFKRLEVLKFNRNFARRTKQRASAMSMLAKLVNADNSSLRELHLTATPKTALKQDLLPFVFQLMVNKTLTLLDVSGHLAENNLGLALGKLLQTNRTLRSLLWDGNQVTSVGFKVFRVGLDRNNVLTHVPFPVVDLLEASKTETTENFAKLQKTVLKIQEHLKTNALVGSIVDDTEDDKDDVPMVDTRKEEERRAAQVAAARQAAAAPAVVVQQPRAAAPAAAAPSSGPVRSSGGSSQNLRDPDQKPSPRSAPRPDVSHELEPVRSSGGASSGAARPSLSTSGSAQPAARRDPAPAAAAPKPAPAPAPAAQRQPAASQPAAAPKPAAPSSLAQVSQAKEPEGPEEPWHSNVPRARRGAERPGNRRPSAPAKPKGIDTIRATSLFSELDSYLQDFDGGADPELSELRAMSARFKPTI